MHFEIMKFLKEKGVEKYDFVGARLCYAKNSKYEGLQRFKSRFGSKLKRGYTFIVPIKKMKYYLFILMVKIYFKLKGSYFEEPYKEYKECNENISNIRL
jgi:lipid II:glycine glycyltransferase (peptidoglycan interpeptide bridge formation enzyme)